MSSVCVCCQCLAMQCIELDITQNQSYVSGVRSPMSSVQCPVSGAVDKNVTRFMDQSSPNVEHSQSPYLTLIKTFWAGWSEAVNVHAWPLIDGHLHTKLTLTQFICEWYNETFCAGRRFSRLRKLMASFKISNVPKTTSVAAAMVTKFGNFDPKLAMILFMYIRYPPQRLRFGGFFPTLRAL